MLPRVSAEFETAYTPMLPLLFETFWTPTRSCGVSGAIFRRPPGWP